MRRQWLLPLWLLCFLGRTLSYTQTNTSLPIAAFNTSMNLSRAGLLLEDLENPNRTSARQIACIAEVIQAVRPDILLLNEIGYDAGREALALF